MMLLVNRAGSLMGGNEPLQRAQALRRHRAEELWHQRHAANLLSAGVPTTLL